MVIIGTISILINIGLVVYLFKPKKKPEKVKLSPEEKEKQKKVKTAFENLMGYDFNVATRRKD